MEMQGFGGEGSATQIEPDKVGVSGHKPGTLIHQHAFPEPSRRANQAQPTASIDQCIDEARPGNVDRGKTGDSRNLDLRSGFCADGSGVEAYGHSEVSLLRVSPLRTRQRGHLAHFELEFNPDLQRLRLYKLPDCSAFVESGE